MKMLNKKSLFFCLCTISASLSAHNMQMDQSSTGGTYYQTDRAATTNSDQELMAKIRDKISSGYFMSGYDHVTVQVRDGVVTLGGSVNTQADKDKVEKEVRNMDGVKSLNSQITITNASKDSKDKFAQDTYGTAADEQLNKKIRDNISRGWLWDSYKDVRLNTTNGDVTLEGTIGSLKDQQKLIDEIQKVEGVKSVKSNLRVTN